MTAGNTNHETHSTRRTGSFQARQGKKLQTVDAITLVPPIEAQDGQAVSTASSIYWAVSNAEDEAVAVGVGTLRNLT